MEFMLTNLLICAQGSWVRCLIGYPKCYISLPKQY
jgi:hypothetical protein